MSDNDQGSGFWTRLGALLLILALMLAALLNDHFVKAPRSAETIKNMNQLIKTETDDGHGIPKDLIQKTLGMKPKSTFKVKSFEVEEYEFKRTLPFFTLRKLFVVYQSQGAATFFEGDRRPTIEMIKRQMGADFIDQSAASERQQSEADNQDHAGHDHANGEDHKH
jgi:hypothetical protein